MINTLFAICYCVCSYVCRGRWPGGLATDAQGHAFLDLDPQLFEIVLNWLRQFNIYRGGNIHEPHVPPDKMVHMVVSWLGAAATGSGHRNCWV